MGPKRSKKSSAGDSALLGTQALPIFNYFSPLAETQASAAAAVEGRAPSCPRVAPGRGAGTQTLFASALTGMPQQGDDPSGRPPHSTSAVQQPNLHEEVRDSVSPVLLEASNGAPLPAPALRSDSAAGQEPLPETQSHFINPSQDATLPLLTSDSLPQIPQ